MTPEELDRAFEAFESDARVMADRYLKLPANAVDWDRYESELRLIIAAHFPPQIRFNMRVQIDTTWGPPIELLITERGAVRL